MVRSFGNRDSFAIEVGDFWRCVDGSSYRGVRHVDLWAGGLHLTRDDNAAYVPTLVPDMRLTIAEVETGAIRACPFPELAPEDVFRRLRAYGDELDDRGELAERHWFLCWDEIMDPVTRYAWQDGDLVLAFQFWRESHSVPEERGRVFVARVTPEEFLSATRAAVDFLARDM